MSEKDKTEFYQKNQDFNRNVLQATTEQPTQEQHEVPLGFSQKLTIEGKIEAIIFSSPQPIKIAEMMEFLQLGGEEYSKKDIEKTVANLVKMYKERGGGFSLVQMEEGFQFRTVETAAYLLEQIFSQRPRPLSRAALETLSVIAYRQPATRADVEFIRGVDSGSIIKNLLDRELISCVGRKEHSGRPMMFGTTAKFLQVFKLNRLEDLPPLVAFHTDSEVLTSEKNLENRDPVDVEGFIGDSPEVDNNKEKTKGLREET